MNPRRPSPRGPKPRTLDQTWLPLRIKFDFLELKLTWLSIKRSLRKKLPHLSRFAPAPRVALGHPFVTRFFFRFFVAVSTIELPHGSFCAAFVDLHIAGCAFYGWGFQRFSACWTVGHEVTQTETIWDAKDKNCEPTYLGTTPWLTRKDLYGC